MKKYIQRWTADQRLRMNITVICHVLWNGAYAAMQMRLGILHDSTWAYSLAGYYASLAIMRFFLVQHTLRHRPGEKVRQELIYYRICGWILLLMNLALSAMMLYMIREERTVRYDEITTIAMATYTFTSLTIAIINVIKYQRCQSPAMSASKAISLAVACVSMLTLENTMLTTFRNEEMSDQTVILFLALSGGAVFLFIMVMAVSMIVKDCQK